MLLKIFLLLGCIHYSKTQTFVMKDAPLIDPNTGKINLMTVANNVFEKVLKPVMIMSWNTSLVTPKYLNKSIDDCFISLNPAVKKSWDGMASDIKTYALSLPSTKLTEIANGLISDIESGTFFYYLVNDKLLLWSFKHLNKAGYQALYRLWYFEHRISADVYDIIQKYFNISYWDEFTRIMMNIDKRNTLYISEEL